jgi:membrane protein required for colicin V production
MNWLDIVIAVILVISIVGGLMAGVIKILFTVAGLIIGVVLAGHYSGALADKLTFISSAKTANIVAFILIMVIVMIIAAVLAFVIKKLASAILLGWINRLGGAILGLFLGMILTGAVLTIWIKYTGIHEVVGNSVLASFLIDKFPVVLGLLPEEFSSVRSYFQ